MGAGVLCGWLCGGGRVGGCVGGRTEDGVNHHGTGHHGGDQAGHGDESKEDELTCGHGAGHISQARVVLLCPIAIARVAFNIEEIRDLLV